MINFYEGLKFIVKELNSDNIGNFRHSTKTYGEINNLYLQRDGFKICHKSGCFILYFKSDLALGKFNYIVRGVNGPERDRLSLYLQYSYQIDPLQTYFIIRKHLNLKPIFEKDRKAFNSVRALEKKYIYKL